MNPILIKTEFRQNVEKKPFIFTTINIGPQHTTKKGAREKPKSPPQKRIKKDKLNEIGKR